MSTSGATNRLNDLWRRYVVDLETPRPWPWETDQTGEFIEYLHRAEDSRLELDPPLYKQAGLAQEQDQWDILCLPKPKNRIRTAHSLGDDGTTIFIREFGELVSLSKFLGRQATPSGTASEPPSTRSGSENDKTVSVEELASDIGGFRTGM